jgi:hypothetical protein
VSTDRPWPLPPPPVKLQCFFCPGETYSPDGICGQCKQEGKSYPSVTVDGVPVEGKWEIGKLPDGAGEFLHNILGGSEPEPGPPYTHTIVPPEPAGWDEDGNPVDPEPEPGPAFTVSDRAAVSERYSPSREAEAFGRTLSASLAAGIEEGSRRAALGLPPEPLSPATEAWLERAVKRSWWALYEDEEP